MRGRGCKEKGHQDACAQPPCKSPLFPVAPSLAAGQALTAAPLVGRRVLGGGLNSFSNLGLQGRVYNWQVIFTTKLRTRLEQICIQCLPRVPRPQRKELEADNAGAVMGRGGRRSPQAQLRSTDQLKESSRPGGTVSLQRQGHELACIGNLFQDPRSWARQRSGRGVTECSAMPVMKSCATCLGEVLFC